MPNRTLSSIKRWRFTTLPTLSAFYKSTYWSNDILRLLSKVSSPNEPRIARQRNLAGGAPQQVADLRIYEKSGSSRHKRIRADMNLGFVKGGSKAWRGNRPCKTCFFQRALVEGLFAGQLLKARAKAEI